MQMLDKCVVLHRSGTSRSDDDVITDAILHPPYKRSGLIVTTHDTPRVRDALRAVIERGEPVVTMVTDVRDIARLHYAGIDNLVPAARPATSLLLGQLVRRPGQVLLLCSRKDYRAHIDRIGGCRAQLVSCSLNSPAIARKWRPKTTRIRCYRAVVSALERGNLAGIYSSGYGSPGIEAALRQSRWRSSGWVMRCSTRIASTSRDKPCTSPSIRTPMDR